MIIPVATKDGQYNIILERGVLLRAAEHMNLGRKVLIVTDSGVPKDYSDAVAKQCANANVVVIPQGEGSKQMDTYQFLLSKMVEYNMTRSDCIVAVGGGVVGDLAGFVAATYMRGVDFYNIPTTLLAQVDSSIGGKTAIDFGNIKNIIGAFYQPKAVLIDPNVLSTLPQRHIANGMAEIVKMAATSDIELFKTLEKGIDSCCIDDIILAALNIKRDVVQKDEKESGLRRVLNFGHTLGHGIESYFGLEKYLHGECVAMGMLPMCGADVKDRLMKLLDGFGLPTKLDGDLDEIIDICRHDKKAEGDKISIVCVDEIGRYDIKNIPFCEFETIVRKGML